MMVVSIGFDGWVGGGVVSFAAVAAVSFPEGVDPDSDSGFDFDSDSGFGFGFDFDDEFRMASQSLAPCLDDDGYTGGLDVAS